MSIRLQTARTQSAAKAWPISYACVDRSEQRRLTTLKPNHFGMGSVVAGSEDAGD
jgi:hypothetical protein